MKMARIPLLCAGLAWGLAAEAFPPAIVTPADTRPNRGDVPDSPHVTGPATPIHRFYNEDLELSFWHGPAEMTFSVAKNDVWDRRYFGDSKRVITLDDVRRVCFAPDAGSGALGSPNSPHGSALGLPGTAQALYLAYDFPCPKPVGQIIVHCADLQGQTEWQAGGEAAGGLVARAAQGTARGSLWASLHRTRNLLLIRGEYASLTQPLQVQLYRHQDTTPQGSSIAGLAHFGGDTGYDYSQDPGNGPLPSPEAGCEGPLFWIRQRFPAEKTFPAGFEVVMAGVIAGTPCETAAQNAVAGAGIRATLHPVTAEPTGWLKEMRLAAQRLNEAASGSLATATLPGPDPRFTLFVAVCTSRDAPDPLTAAKADLASALEEGPERVLQESFTASREQVRAWRDSRVLHYNATSCTWADATPWHGDYHFNEVYAGQDIVAGNVAALEQRLRLVEEMVPALQRHAREAYGCRGLAFTLVHYPIKADRVVYSNAVWEWGMENTALMLQPFWQAFQYTWDLETLRRRVYPLLAEGARFYADYVKRGEDGFYHVIPTVSQEHWGFSPEWRLNRDSVGALSMIKYHLKTAVQAAELLGQDAAEVTTWREIAGHLAPYPTLQTEQGPVFCDVRDAPSLLDYNITANLVMTLWAEDISLDSPPDVLELARRSYRALPNKERSMRPGYLNQIATCLGIPERVDLSPMGRVLSWPGRIHLYAGVPTGALVNDTFSGLLAVGGFEVAAQHAGADITGVRIRSRAGRECRLKSPWGLTEVKVIEMPTRAAVAPTWVADTIVFATRPGCRYAVLAGPELALAQQRFVPALQTVGRWSFARSVNDVVRDESGNGHDAILRQGAALATADEKRVLSLTGDSQYAEIGRAPAFNFAATESFAIAVRFRAQPDAAAGMTPLLCSMDLKQYCLTLQNGRADLYLSSPAGEVNCHVGGEAFLADGRWHDLRAVRDVADGMLRLTVDGRQDGESQDLTSGDFASSVPLTVGAYLWGEHSRYARAEIATLEVSSLGRMATVPDQP
jgi:hypothetical protein